MSYTSVNPATGETIKSYDEFTAAQLEERIAKAASAFREWRRSDFAHRAACLTKVASILEERAEEYARLMALEVGKPVIEGEAESKKSALACRFYAEKGEEFMAPQVIETDASLSKVVYEPLGPILAIMPWNYPFWQLFRHACPALMAGNVVLLKHTPHTPDIALELERIFLEAGYPEGCMQALFISNEQAAEVIADPRVPAVTLTGSTGAGKKVAEAAGRSLKKTVLELGGSDPFIVLADADLELAASTGVAARCLNSGQSCIAAKRFLVHNSVLEEFTALFVDKMKARVMGDPMQRETNIGPMARLDLRDQLAAQVHRSVDAGAKLLLGGEIPEGSGFYFPPTVLSHPPKDSPAYYEELFGPVATIIPVSSEDDAVSVANDSEYGLGAAIFTADMEKANDFVSRIEAGAVFVNGLVKSDPRLPFGGIKNSGYGRELSREGMIEFTNQKTVWIK